MHRIGFPVLRLSCVIAVCSSSTAARGGRGIPGRFRQRSDAAATWDARGSECSLPQLGLAWIDAQHRTLHPGEHPAVARDDHRHCSNDATINIVHV